MQLGLSIATRNYDNITTLCRFAKYNYSFIENWICSEPSRVIDFTPSFPYSGKNRCKTNKIDFCKKKFIMFDKKKTDSILILDWSINVTRHNRFRFEILYQFLFFMHVYIICEHFSRITKINSVTFFSLKNEICF